MTRGLLTAMFARGQLDQLSRGPSCLGAELTGTQLGRDEIVVAEHSAIRFSPHVRPNSYIDIRYSTIEDCTMKKTINRSCRRVPFPCGVCDKACGVDTINCDGCGVWIHRACVPMTTKQFTDFGRPDAEFRCRRCTCDESGASLDYIGSLRRYVHLSMSMFML